MDREGSVKSDTAKKSKMKFKLGKEDKISLLLFLTEIIILGILMALNYILRFDDYVTDASDMIAYDRVLLSCDQSYLRYEISRPYFDYSPKKAKSLYGLELEYDLPEWAFFLAALLTPIAIISVFEASKHFILIQWKEKKGFKTKNMNRWFKEPLTRIIKIVGGYLLGGSIAGLFTSVMKLNIVSPRPNFMSICFFNGPSIDYSVCTSEQSYWSPYKECTNEEKQVAEGLRSFPSYHATLATYGAIFTSAYIIFSVKFRGTFSSPILLILGVMVMGVIGATHRLATGYSFPRDIVGGIIIGFFAAYYMIVYRLNEFDRRVNLKKILQIDNVLDNSKLGQEKLSKDDSDSDLDDNEEPADFERWATKIDSHKYLPRIQSEISISKPTSELYSSQVQAVNPTMKPDDSFEAKHFPSSKPVTAKRSQSSASQKEGRPSREDYDNPRQRQSAPMLQEGKGNGYTNYGFSGPANEPKMVLSAYKPRGNEDLSRF